MRRDRERAVREIQRGKVGGRSIWKKKKIETRNRLSGKKKEEKTNEKTIFIFKNRYIFKKFKIIQVILKINIIS